MTEQQWTEKQEAAYTEAVEQAKTLYNDAQGSWVDFALHLRGLELGGVWRRPEFNGFAGFLRREFPAAWGFERYTHVIKAIEVYGAEFMRRLGIESAHAITLDGLLVNEGAVAEVREACEEHFREHGIMPGVDTVRDYVDNVLRPRRAASRLVKRRNELVELKRENAQLTSQQSKAETALSERDGMKAEVKRLTDELKRARTRIRELERENTKLAKALERAQGKRKAA